MKSNKAFECVVQGIFLALGLVTVACVLLITVYMVISGIPAIIEIGLWDFLFGKVWDPAASDPRYSKGNTKPITGTIVTTNHNLDVPNSLEKKVYDNFQSLKALDEQGKIEDATSTKQKLLGQIQASRNIDDKRFPEISRLTIAIPTERSPITKSTTRSVSCKKARIKIKAPTN